VRPKINIPLTRFDWALEAIAFLIWLGGLLFLVLNFETTPDQIPTHYDHTGTATTSGSKNSLWLLVAISTSLYVLLTIAARFPHTFNYPVEITPQNAERQYSLAVRMMLILKLVVLKIFVYAHLTSMLARQLGGWFLPVLTIVLIGVIGMYIWKANSTSE
jgi:uncharacterized membrane protein